MGGRYHSAGPHVKLALLNRRMTTLMALAALGAFGAGSGASAYLFAAAAGLIAAVVWRPSAGFGRRIEQIGWMTAIAIFFFGLYVAVVVQGDYLPLTLAFLLVLLVTEALRPLDAANDLRMYALSFAVLIASTAYYPGVPFALAFVAYLGCATLALMVGHLNRQAVRYSVSEIPLRSSFLVGTAALSTVAVLASALVFLAFPRLPRGWIGSARAATHGAMVGFGEGVSLGEFGGRIQSNPEVVFRVEFDGPPPGDIGSIQWRGRSYDFFDGVRWSRSHDMPLAIPPPRVLEARWATGGAREYQIFGGPPGAPVLFGIHPILNVVPRTPMRPVLDSTGDVVVARAESPVYRVSSGSPHPGVPSLRTAAGPDLASARWYLQLPPRSPRLQQLADSLTAEHSHRYDATRAVEHWLRQEFTYTLELPSTPREASLEHFLFERRQGHCEYFSTAMVVLLRAAGIPARNVTGFMGGEWNASAGYLAVTQNDAHSWVEVWFPELGWVPFDPTPAASRNRVTGIGAHTSVLWPVRFWWDGLQHRWTRWVLFYDMEKQLLVMRRVSALFSGSGLPSARSASWSGLARERAGWLFAGLTLAALVWVAARKTTPRRPLSPETRWYLELRRSYHRAGYGNELAPPKRFLETLRTQDAPGLEAAAPAIDLYLRSRFGAADLTVEGLAGMRRAVYQVRKQLRRERRRPVNSAGWSARSIPRQELLNVRLGVASDERDAGAPEDTPTHGTPVAGTVNGCAG
jgi:protein-glutamine gamma-glutamyltransferase